MKQFVFQITVLVIVVIVGFYLTSQQNFFGKKISDNTQKTTDGNTKTLRIISADLLNSSNSKAEIKVEIADTKEKRSKGLGGRESLASDSGMLFIFDKPEKYTFWMKGVSFPLDFIWIKGNDIVEISSDIPPAQGGQKDEDLPRYSPSAEADKVLEVNSGFSKEHDIKSGDQIYLK